MYIDRSDIERARNVAKKFNNTHIITESLIYALLERPDFVTFLNVIDPRLSITVVKKTLEDILQKKSVKETIANPPTSFSLEIILKRSMASSLLVGERTITFNELIVSICEEQDPSYINILFKRVNNNVINNVIHMDNLIEEAFTTGKVMNNNNNNTTSAKFQEFLKYTTNLNEEIVQNPTMFTKAISREDELLEMERVLLRKSKNSVILTGEPGVGKSNLVESFAYKLVRGEVNETLKDIKIYTLNIHKLLSDIKFHGVLEARLSDIIGTLEEDRNKVLFIDEMHMLYNAGGNNANLDIMNFLKAPMSKNKIRIIGATTKSEYRRYVEKNSAFTRRFCHIDVGEPNTKDTINILNLTKSSFEDYYGIKIGKDIIPTVVNLSDAYIKHRFNPDKSIDILDSIMARKKLINSTSLSVSDVYNEISKECKIPSDEISKNKSEKLELLRDRLNSKIIGQDKIFDDLIDILYVSSAGLKEQEKPMGSFLFQGSTSSGKTESSKIIAETFGIPLIRYDMSAFQEKHTVSTLIGSPPGYVGFSDGSAGSGKLINDIETNPHCVLLLDEIEKAHPDVLNILLQIMDYGKLTSSAGKDVYFSKVILIMTSNIGSRDSERNSIGFTGANQKEEIINESISQSLAPEFRARIDGILKFNTLNKTNIMTIARNYLDQFNIELKKHKINLSYDDSILSHIADKSIESKLNARYVQGYISKTIKTRIARNILNQETGDRKIILTNDNLLDII